MSYDLVIKNGRVIDGSGGPGVYADVAVAKDKIVGVGKFNESATRTINAEGRVVAPGFIDMHSHSDLAMLNNPRHEAKVSQGVTTEALGQDGLSYAPLSPGKLEPLLWYLAAVNGAPPQTGRAHV